MLQESRQSLQYVRVNLLWKGGKSWSDARKEQIRQGLKRQEQLRRKAKQQRSIGRWKRFHYDYSKKGKR